MSRKFWNWIYLFIFFLPLSLCGLSHINMTTADHNVSNYHTETATFNYKYETNDVSSGTDILPGNVYQVQFVELLSHGGSLDEITFDYILIDHSFCSLCFSSDGFYINTFYDYSFDGVSLSVFYGDLELYDWIGIDDIVVFSSSYEYLSTCFDDWDAECFSSCPDKYNIVESVTITESDTLVKWFDYEDDVLSVVDGMGALLPVSAFYKLIFTTPNIWLKSIFLGADLVIWASVCHIVMDLFMLFSKCLSRLFSKFGGAD